MICVTAQEQTPTGPSVFRGGVDVLPLDVSVIDRDGRPLRGLQAADFRVVVDGDERPIVAFSAVEVPDAVRAGARWLREVAPDVSTNGFVPDRVVVLLLDDWNTASDASAAVAVRKIGQAIVDELGPSDLAAVVYPFLTARGVEFTTDRRRLRAAVDRFTSAKLDGSSGACMSQSCVFGTMRAVAAAAQSWPDRRKLLIYISPQGYYSIGPQNVEYVTDNPDVRLSEANAAAVDMSPALLDVFRDLHRANVTVYQFDPRGLSEIRPGIDAQSRTPITVATFGLQGSVGMFADHTGGRTFTRTNDPWLRAPEVFAENRSYYMLGVVPSTRATRSGFHPLRVTVNRPGAVVRARLGYYDPAPEQTPRASATRTALDRAADGVVPLADLPLGVTAAAFRVAGAYAAAVAVVAGIDRGPVESTDETIDVAVRAFDERSAQRRAQGVWTAKMRLVPQVSAFGAVHYDTLLRLDLAPGYYELRLSMQRASDRVAGGVTTSIVIPDFEKERLSVSGVVLGRVQEASLAAGEPMADVLPFAPTTRRAFGPSETVAALVRVYQGGKGLLQPVAVTTRITDASDERVLEVTSTLTPSAFVGPTRSAEVQMRLPLARLRTGEYLLTINAALEERTLGATPVRFHVR